MTTKYTKTTLYLTDVFSLGIAAGRAAHDAASTSDVEAAAALNKLSVKLSTMALEALSDEPEQGTSDETASA